MKRVVLILFIGLAIASCKRTNKEAEELNKKFHALTSLDVSKAHELDEAYKAYFVNHPNDTILPALYYQDAQLNVTFLKDNDNALKLLNKILSDFPGHRRTPDILLFEGFIYENNLKDTTKAIQQYTRILQQYPKHELASQADFCIKSLRSGALPK